MLSPAREAAWRVLVRLGADRPTGTARLDDTLVGLPELEQLDARDRALAHELITGTIKRRLSIDSVVGMYTKAPLERTESAVLASLRLATFQILFLDRVPAHAAVDDAVTLVADMGKQARGFVNAVLRKVAREGRETFARLADGSGDKEWGVRHSCPRWLVRLLRDELGDAAARSFLDAANAAPERCLRVNSRRCTLVGAVAALAEAGFETTPVSGLDQALLYEGPALERSAPFRAGVVTPQSRGSQLAGIIAAEALRAGAPLAGASVDDEPAAPRVLDLCAAPGTKTSQLAAALPGARITAVELDAARLTAMRANLERLGIDAAPQVELVAADVLDLPETFDGVFDAVLLDAPCSGLGTLASRADLRWRRRAADVPRLADLQGRLLARAARCVRPGGTLTYAVCTLPRAETVAVVRSFASAPQFSGWLLDGLGAARPEFAHPEMPEALRVLPPDGGSTGFFVARLRLPGA
ncbi:MAG: transcription antitermination factor NusB [Thermoleophilia bacterium]